MTFMVTHRDGTMERGTDLSMLDLLIAELDPPDPEHPDISVTKDGIWTLSAFSDGTVIWENLEEGEPRHLKEIDRSGIRSLLHSVATGALSEVEREPWRPGYP